MTASRPLRVQAVDEAVAFGVRGRRRIRASLDDLIARIVGARIGARCIERLAHAIIGDGVAPHIQLRPAMHPTACSANFGLRPAAADEQ